MYMRTCWFVFCVGGYGGWGGGVALFGWAWHFSRVTGPADEDDGTPTAAKRWAVGGAERPVCDGRTKSSQRWLKLRTTVQLTGVMASAASASAQRRGANSSSLKREDSFIQRFSTRQLPEIQETFDDGDGCPSSGLSSARTGLFGSSGPLTFVPFFFIFFSFFFLVTQPVWFKQNSG